MSTSRKAMLGKVHIARKDLRLEDGDYRDLLQRITGQRTAATCTDDQLHAVLREFQRLGFKPQAGAPRYSDKPHIRKLWAVWSDLRLLLDDADDNTLRAFVRRQTHSDKNPDGIADPEWLDPAEAKKVIHGLQGWLNRVRTNRGKPMARLPGLYPQTESTLTDSDKAFLRSCPRTIMVARGAAVDLALIKRVRKLQVARLVTGKVQDKAQGDPVTRMEVMLTAAGRAAIGLPQPPDIVA